MSEELSGTRAHGLESVQRWMQAVVTHPEGVGAGLASAEARAAVGAESRDGTGLGEAETILSEAETIVAPSPTLTGAERLAVYSHAYRARLVGCLRETFPAMLRALGEKVFDLFALDYLKRHPPRGYTLDRLAEAFPRHLAETRPDVDAPASEREAWADFLVELATIELAFAQVYDGPGLEGRPAPRAGDVRRLPGERLFETAPKRAPCLRLFAFGHPVHAYMLAARGGESPAPPRPAETFVAMTRRDYGVLMYELKAPQYFLLRAIDGRRTVGRAVEAAAPHAGRPMSFEVVREWLCEWAERGFFESV